MMLRDSAPLPRAIRVALSTAAWTFAALAATACGIKGPLVPPPKPDAGAAVPQSRAPAAAETTAPSTEPAATTPATKP